MSQQTQDEPYLGEIPGLRHHVSIFEEKHMVSILFYLLENDGCPKTSIYDSVSRGTRMPIKLDTLEKAGMIALSKKGGSNMVTVNITETGRKVAESLRAIEGMLSQASRGGFH